MHRQMICRFARAGAVAAALGALGALPCAAQDLPFVAGVDSSARPPQAPRITTFTPPPGWRERALHGVEQPYPPSLRWLDDQGAWFTPFAHPGATGPYDLRHWYGAS